MESYTAADRQRCIDSLIEIVSGNVSNPLLDAAGVHGKDYSIFINDIKIKFLGFDAQNKARFTGINNLVFSFNNKSPIKASISGSGGCNFVNWRYYKNGTENRITKYAHLDQNGPNIIDVDPGKAVNISYEISNFNTPTFGTENNRNSTCQFFVGFGSQALSHTAVAIVDSPRRPFVNKAAGNVREARDIRFQDLAFELSSLRGTRIRVRAVISCLLEIESCAIYPIEKGVPRRAIYLNLGALVPSERKRLFLQCHPRKGGCRATVVGTVTADPIQQGDIEISEVEFW